MKRLREGKSRQGWPERWGRYGIGELGEGPRIWVHAASVGEVSAAIPILTEVKRHRADSVFIMTVITPGGYEIAASELGKVVDSVNYAPFDMSWIVTRAIRAIRPDLLLVMETEIWPNMIHHAKSSGACVVLANARISDKSFPRYLSARGLFRWALSKFNRILTQSDTDSERFRAIGAEPGAVETTGNTKFDQPVPSLSGSQGAELKSSLRIDPSAPVLVIGSTRTSDEEQILFRAYNAVRQSIPKLTLIHAPRHVDRAGEVESLMRDSGLEPVKRTALDAATGTVKQLILDTFGELSAVYGIADIAYIGNSLTPPGGGQNLLQPLAHGKPVIYGPYMQNFRDLESMAADSGVGFCVRDENELAAIMVELLNDSARRADLNATAKGLVESNRGAAARYADAILALLPPSRERG